MDKEKFDKMFETMEGFWTDEKGMTNCCSMMMKMMQFGRGKEEEKKEKDTEKKA